MRQHLHPAVHRSLQSSGADMFPVTAAEFTAEGIANILVNQYISSWGFPRTILSDNGLQSCSKLSQAVYQLLGVHKLSTSSYHLNCNGGVEWVNYTMVQMLAMVVNERQDDWACICPTSNSITTIQSARRQFWRPTRSTWADSHGSP